MIDPQVQFAHERYMRAAHAMQSGVAMEMTIPDHSASIEPKHLRVGINSALADSSGLAKLLMNKGIITELEYVCAMADAMEAEQKRFEVLLSQLLGTNITLA